MANSTIEKYNQITGNTVADGVEKYSKWQALIAENPMLNVSGEKPVAYNGVNAVNIALSNAARGNEDNRFMTRKQAQGKGLKIKDEAKAIAVSYTSSQDRDIKGEDGVIKKVSIPFMRVGYIYNAKDIEGMPKAKAQAKNGAGLNADALIKKSSIKVTQKGTKAFYDDKNKTIVLPAKLKGDALVATYASIASKVAVNQNYTRDSKDVRSFKAQMAAALMTQKAGAKFLPQGVGKVDSFNADFLKDPKQGVKAIRSSAKIANFVIDGKSFEMTKGKKVKATDDKAKAPKAKAKSTPVKAKGKNAQALVKRRAKTNQREGLSR